MASKKRGSRKGGRGCKGPVRSAVAKCAKRSGKTCSRAISKAARSCIGYSSTTRKSRGRTRRRGARNIQAAMKWF